MTRIEEILRDLKESDEFPSPIPPYGINHATAMELARHIDHLTAQLDTKDQERKDLAMLVRRLCFALKDSKPKLKEQAYDYLIRKGLQGSILREEQADGSN